MVTTSESNCSNGMLRLLLLDTATKEFFRLAFIMSSLNILAESWLSNAPMPSDLGPGVHSNARNLFLFISIEISGNTVSRLGLKSPCPVGPRCLRIRFYWTESCGILVMVDGPFACHFLRFFLYFRDFNSNFCRWRLTMGHLSTLSKCFGHLLTISKCFGHLLYHYVPLWLVNPRFST